MSKSFLPDQAGEKIVIAATFTAEPIAQSLQFWERELGLPLQLAFAPYNQVLQQLFDPSSALNQNKRGLNVLLVRVEDWLREVGNATLQEKTELLKQTAADLLDALKAALQNNAAAHLFVFCPGADRRNANSELQELFERTEASLAKELSTIGGLYVSRPADLAAYAVTDYYDPIGDEKGHIPYRPAFFHALGTIVARKLFAIRARPYKVIVLDCDQTVWKGVCGEDGPMGIELDSARTFLQQFMVEQHNAGMLLCLCSKNIEEDVAEVFSLRPEMPLKREHIVSWRINWTAKSTNIKALAEELQLGLDSFIFIDDNPMECAEVEANCPEVLTLLLPKNPDEIPRFLQHLWAFDRLKVTEEDKKRTALYKENVQREVLRKSSGGLKDFLASLRLEVRFLECTDQYLARASQLTQRTNQFNFTGRRRTESELQQLCSSEGATCTLVEVTDRFGSYGIVGVVISLLEGTNLVVDTFLLSCRVLGKGVEHQILARLGQDAIRRGGARVRVPFIPTKKNKPASQFIESVGAAYRTTEADAVVFDFPAEAATKLSYEPTGDDAPPPEEEKKTEAPQAAGRSAPAILVKIASSYNTIESIVSAVTSPTSRRPRSLDRPYVAPRSKLESLLAECWSDVLQIDQVGIDDNFFDFGADSLEAARVNNAIEEKLGEMFHVATFFDIPSIRGFAEYILKQHPAIEAKLEGNTEGSATGPLVSAIDDAQVQLFKKLIPPVTSTRAAQAKNRRAIFVLGPPRSGTTLLRAMLAGNPQLFAPPELELLPFANLGERKAAFSGRDSGMREGTIRAVMELKGITVGPATELMEQYERENMSTHDFYGMMQRWAGDRILVDKTPSYALDKGRLQRAEQIFDAPDYIHLVRHPTAVVRSFVESKMDQLFYRYEHPFSSAQVGELSWLVSQENILGFLSEIQPGRHHRVVFEDLVREPARVLEGLCEKLRIPFTAAMLDPYADGARMTDGIHQVEGARMVGDPKFHKHKKIDAGTAEKWRESAAQIMLGEATVRVAEQLGYADSVRSPAGADSLLSPVSLREQTLPLSFGQERLWRTAQAKPGEPFLNAARTVRLVGPLHVTALEHSFNEVARRHESLRTHFQVMGSTGVQVVSPFSPIELEIVDLTGAPQEERAAKLNEAAVAFYMQPYALEQPPLWKPILVRISDNEHVLLIKMHHIITDGWSWGILFKEMSALYTAYCEGRESPLPALPVQYPDYAVWQRKRVSGALWNDQLAYWKKHLEGSPERMPLPTTAKPGGEAGGRAKETVVLDRALIEKIKGLSQREGVSNFITMFAAFNRLLHNHNQQKELVVGVPIAVRSPSVTEKMIGYFLNHVALRTDLSGNPSFSELVSRARTVCLGALQNRDIPVREALGMEASSRFYQVRFNFVPATAGLTLPNIESTLIEIPWGKTGFDLYVNTDETAELSLVLQYKSDLFESRTITNLLSEYQEILLKAVA